MKNDLIKAVVNATGKEVEVYRYMNGEFDEDGNPKSYIDYEDCETEYKKEELTFKK